MQFKLTIAFVAAMAAASMAAPTLGYGTDFTDLAQRSTADDLAYLEARYSDVDYDNYFAREPEPSHFDKRSLEFEDQMVELAARGDPNGGFNIFKAIFARSMDQLTPEQVAGFSEMDAECAKLASKKDAKKCQKFVSNLKTILGEQHWGYRHWLAITHQTHVPVSVDLKLETVTSVKPGKEAKTVAKGATSVPASPPAGAPLTTTPPVTSGPPPTTGAPGTQSRVKA